MSVEMPINFHHDGISPAIDVLPPLSLYIHIPWCIRKCPYCDFYSHRLDGELSENQYITALQRDIELALPLIWGRKIISIFIGGGTPSLFSASGLDKLLSMVRSLLPVLPDAEISMEANPGTVEQAKFRAYRDCGINRLSLGIQSFNAEHLRRLGRIHGRDEALRAAESAKECFTNFNLDLMIGLPGQTLQEFQEDVQTALSCRPNQLSLYQLTIEPDTPFANNPPTLPDEEALDRMQRWMEQRLPDAEYRHYEVSAWSLDGYQCQHNSNYWLYGDYLGIGAAAHSKITMPDAKIIRKVCVKNPDAYMAAKDARSIYEESFEVTAEDRAFEFMMNALRFVDGFPVRLFSERTGLPLSMIDAPMKEALSKGLLQMDKGILKPTQLGMRFLNDLQEMFLPED